MWIRYAILSKEMASPYGSENVDLKLRNTKLKKQLEDEQRYSKSLQSKIELDQKLVVRRFKEEEAGKSQNSFSP